MGLSRVPLHTVSSGSFSSRRFTALLSDVSPSSPSSGESLRIAAPISPARASCGQSLLLLPRATSIEVLPGSREAYVSDLLAKIPELPGSRAHHKWLDRLDDEFARIVQHLFIDVDSNHSSDKQLVGAI